MLFTTSPPTLALVDRSLAGNTIYFVDTPPATDSQSGVLNGAIATSTFSLPPSNLLAVLLSGFEPGSPQLAGVNESLARAKIPFSVQRQPVEAS